MQKFLATLSIFCLIFIAPACVATGPGEEMVVSTPNYLREGVITTPGPEQEAALIERDVLLGSEKIPQSIRDGLDRLFPDVEVFVITSRLNLVDNVPATDLLTLQVPVLFDPETGETKPNTVGFLSGLLQVLGGVIPGSAPYLGLGTYLLALFARKRPRKHLGQAMKAILPINGSIELGSGISNISKAIGLSHTEDTPEELLESANKIALRNGKRIAISPNGTPVLVDILPVIVEPQ